MKRVSLALAAVVLLAVPTALAEDAASPSRAPENPFELAQRTLIPGTTFVIRAGERFAASDELHAELSYVVPEKSGILGKRSVPVAVRAIKPDPADARRHLVEARVPTDLADLKTQSTLGGVLYPYRATLRLTRTGGAGTPEAVELDAAIPSVAWAWIWGLAVVALGLLGFQVVVGREQRARGDTARRSASPLALTTTPVGGYSLSKAQILLWSCVTAFGLVYVYFLTLEFLAITTQVLLLLGIGGSTAIATQISNDDASVARQMALAGMVPRAPRLADLVWSGGRPDIFKFQMLIFTLLTAGIVFSELVRQYTFPAIPENLVALMGVSSAVYVSNKVVTQKQNEKDREAIDAKEAEILARRGPVSDQDRAELKALLERVYR
jgi:hypothetical protein